MLDILSSFSRFKDAIPDKIIIWGAGYWGKRTYEWLKEQNFDNKIICFIDINPKLHDTILFDKKIFLPSCLDSFRDASVIASIIPWREIYETMKENDYTNDLYVAVHNILTNGISNQNFKFSIEDMYNVYVSNDQYTRSIIRLHELIRKNIYTVIIPIKTMLQNNDLSATGTKPTGYWESEEAKIDCFNSYTLIDGGAFIGDSLQSIANTTSSILNHAYCFEPDRYNAERLRQFVDKERLNDTVSIYESGLAEKNMVMGIEEVGTTGANLVNSSDGFTNVTSIDSLELKIKGKLCIKLDVEGFELAALKGAINTIKKYKPELAICVYHKNDDVYEIPSFIKSIVPEYNCILRGSWHMVCMASVERYGTI